MNILLSMGAGIVILCILSTRISAKLSIPSLLLFIGLGMLLGSDGVFRIHFDDYRVAEQICTYAFVFIIFYGGFCMNWKSARPIALKASLLSTMGIVLTCGLVGGFAYFALSTSLLEGLLIGAVLSATDAASVFHILRMKKLNLKGGLAPLLEMESGSNDPFAYMLTVMILGMMAGEGHSLGLLLFTQIVFGIGFGFLCGWVGLFLLKHARIKEIGLHSIFVAAIALLSYTMPSLLEGNGFLSVYITGIVLGNAKIRHKVELVGFFDSISQMMQIILFFLLGLLSFPSQIPQIAGSAILIVLFLTFVARPLVVFICLLPFHVPWKHQLFLSWSGLRGASAIVFAIMSVVSPAYTKNDIFHIVFFVSLLSITLQGSLLPFMAKRLGVEDEENDTMKTFNDYTGGKALVLSEVTLPSAHPWNNKTLQEIITPDGMLIVSIKRDGASLLPKGETRILSGDVLIMCSPMYEENGEIELEEIVIQAKDDWLGLTMNDIDTESFLVVMIKRGKEYIVPHGDTMILEEDGLVICRKKEG